MSPVTLIVALVLAVAGPVSGAFLPEVFSKWGLILADTKTLPLEIKKDTEGCVYNFNQYNQQIYHDTFGWASKNVTTEMYLTRRGVENILAKLERLDKLELMLAAVTEIFPDLQARLGRFEEHQAKLDFDLAQVKKDTGSLLALWNHLSDNALAYLEKYAAPIRMVIIWFYTIVFTYGQLDRYYCAMLFVFTVIDTVQMVSGVHVVNNALAATIAEPLNFNVFKFAFSIGIWYLYKRCIDYRIHYLFIRMNQDLQRRLEAREQQAALALEAPPVAQRPASPVVILNADDDGDLDVAQPASPLAPILEEAD
jgi:hypothetical protein